MGFVGGGTGFPPIQNMTLMNDCAASALMLTTALARASITYLSSALRARTV